MIYKITIQDFIKPIINHVFQKMILYFFKLVNNQNPIFTQYLLCMYKVCYKEISHQPLRISMDSRYLKKLNQISQIPYSMN